MLGHATCDKREQPRTPCRHVDIERGGAEAREPDVLVPAECELKDLTEELRWKVVYGRRVARAVSLSTARLREEASQRPPASRT